MASKQAAADTIVILNNQSSNKNPNGVSELKEHDHINEQKRSLDILANEKRNMSELIPQLTFSDMKQIHKGPQNGAEDNRVEQEDESQIKNKTPWPNNTSNDL